MNCCVISNLLGVDGMRGWSLFIPLRIYEGGIYTHVLYMSVWDGHAVLNKILCRLLHSSWWYTAGRAWLVCEAKDAGAYINFGGGVIISLHMRWEMCTSCALALDGVHDGERCFSLVTCIHVQGASIHTWEFTRVRRCSLRGAVTCVKIHMSICSLVRRHYTCGSRQC